jgi:hypothetical protein
MHALVARVTIQNADRTPEVLNSQVVPVLTPGARRALRHNLDDLGPRRRTPKPEEAESGCQVLARRLVASR